jgi:hypothetical protein
MGKIRNVRKLAFQPPHIIPIGSQDKVSDHTSRKGATGK